jgi:hypothetical protein
VASVEECKNASPNMTHPGVDVVGADGLRAHMQVGEWRVFRADVKDGKYDDVFPGDHRVGRPRKVVEAPPRPLVVCLCGSTRFYDAFQKANFDLTMSGAIVLFAGFDPKSGAGLGITEDQKVALDELHKRKIDLADEVLVLNVNGYVGASTRSEILYARKLGKPIRWLEPLPEIGPEVDAR